jgi:hypothetical protein
VEPVRTGPEAIFSPAEENFFGIQFSFAKQTATYRLPVATLSKPDLIRVVFSEAATS